MTKRNGAEYLAAYREILARMKSEMTQAELCGSVSHNFIVQMIPHHEAAIAMSECVMKFTDSAQLCAIAERIVSSQKQGVAEMKQILCCCGEKKNTPCELKGYAQRNDEILAQMFKDMDCACTDGCVSCDFMRQMIPHHEGAVRMAENALKFPICEQLRPILCDIIATQKKGICEMERLMEKLSCRM